MDANPAAVSSLTVTPISISLRGPVTFFPPPGPSPQVRSSAGQTRLRTGSSTAGSRQTFWTGRGSFRLPLARVALGQARQSQGSFLRIGGRVSILRRPAQRVGDAHQRRYPGGDDLGHVGGVCAADAGPVGGEGFPCLGVLVVPFDEVVGEFPEEGLVVLDLLVAACGGSEHEGRDGVVFVDGHGPDF